MNDFLNQIKNFSDPGVSITFANISLSLMFAFLLSVVVAKTYQLTYRGAAFSPSFMHTLVICAMVISAVMLIIGSNIARAFSLVGALSIIRFRNAVKDPRDVAYIFLAMGIGMAAGTGFYSIAVLLTGITCFAALLLSVLRFGEHSLVEKLVKIQTPPVENFEHIFDEVLASHTEEFTLLSAQSSRMGTEMELTFSVKVPKKFSIQKLIEDISKINSNLKVEVLGTTHVLDI